MWVNVPVRLRKRNNTQRVGRNGLVVVGDLSIPDKISGVLNKGPKFSLEPNVRPHELPAINRNIASKAHSEERERCLLAGVHSLTRTVEKGYGLRSKACTTEIVAFFNASCLRLLQADKEGCFVVMKAKDFHEKAGQAVLKNFVPAKKTATKAKTEAFLCKDLRLHRLA